MSFNEYVKKQLKDSAFAAEYKALDAEYQIKAQIIEARQRLNLSQKELAERVGTKQSNISRLENGSYNPSFGFLQKVALGLGKELHIEFR